MGSLLIYIVRDDTIRQSWVKAIGLDGKIGIFNFQGADTDANGTKRSCENIITGQEENVNNFLLSPYLRKISKNQNIVQ